MSRELTNNNLNNIETLLQIFEHNIFLNLNVCLPVIVDNYNKDKNTVDLQIGLQAVMEDNSFEDMPVLLDVPVISLGGNNLSIIIPLKKGDTGLCLFCDRDISLFVENLKKTQPQTLRKHDLSDGIFIPSTFSKIIPTEDTNIVIQNADGTTKLSIKENGIDIVGDLNIDGNITATGDIAATGKMEAGNGATGTFTDTGSGASGKTLTITKGIITNIT